MATTPSIAMIPSGYKAGKVYSVLPTDGSGDLTFARASTATRINKNNLIENVGNNVPRLDYEGGGCPSLLLEPSSTNLITQSEDFSNAEWVKLGAGTGSGAIVTSNYAISPDGTLNASRLQCNLNSGGSSSSNQSLIYDIYSSSGNQTISIYVKSNNGQNQTIYFANTQTSGDTIIVTPEWQRFTFSHSVSTYIIAVGLRGRSVGAIDDTADILIWGAQAEQKSYATSYIKTSGSQITRLAETANGSGNASTFNDSEGVLFAETSALANDVTGRKITLNNGSNSQVLVLEYTSTSNQIRVFLSNGSLQFNQYVTLSDSKLYNKIAIKYKENDFSLFVNGIEEGQDASGTTFASGTLTNINFDDGSGNADFYGKTKQIQYFNTALTSLEIETLTSYSSFNEMALNFNYTI